MFWAWLPLFLYLCNLLWQDLVRWSTPSLLYTASHIIAGQRAVLDTTGEVPRFPPPLHQLAALSHSLPELFYYVLGVGGAPLFSALLVATLAGVILSGRSTALGAIQGWLESPWLAPLSTLSYPAYLVHTTLQLRYAGAVDQAFGPAFTTAPAFLGHIVFTVLLSFVAAAILHVFIDAPVSIWLNAEAAGGLKHRICLIYSRISLGATVLMNALSMPLMLFLFSPNGRYSADLYHPALHPSFGQPL